MKTSLPPVTTIGAVAVGAVLLYTGIKILRGKLYDFVFVGLSTGWYREVLDLLPQKSRMLDVGIGTGMALIHNKELVEKKEIFVDGVDYDADYIVDCKKNVRDHKLDASIHVHHGSIYDYTSPTPYDAVYFSASLMIMPDPVQALKHTASLLNATGRIYVTQTIQTQKSWITEVGKPLLKFITTVDFGNVTYEDDLARTVDAAGLKIVLNQAISGSSLDSWSSSCVFTFCNGQRNRFTLLDVLHLPLAHMTGSLRVLRHKPAAVAPYDEDMETNDDVDRTLLATDIIHARRKGDFRRWDFNVFVLDTPLAQLDFVCHLSAHFDLHSQFGLSQTQMGLFFADVQAGYDLPPSSPVTRLYHTFLHAVDVMQSVAVFLKGFEGSQYVQPIAAASLLVASLCHDIGHLGLTNQYLINSGHPLTLEYRNPVLESMHTARTMALIKHHGFLKHLQVHESLRISKTIARCILFTDVSIHSDLLRKVKALPRQSAVYEDEASVVYCGFLLHAADICNPAKAWPLATKWTSLIMSEFFEQGALERAEGIVVSAFRNADLINTSEIQANFVQLMLQPTLSLLSNLLPLAAPLLDIAEANRIRWENERKQSLTPPQVKLVQELARPLELRQLTPYQAWTERMHKWLLSPAVIAIVFLASIYATFGAIVHAAFVPIAADQVVGLVTLVVFAILILDMCVTTCVVGDYRWSFYFWLDLVSIATLVVDIWTLSNLSTSTTLSVVAGSSTNRHLHVVAARCFRLARLVRMCTLFKTFKEIAIRRRFKPCRQNAPMLPDAPTFTFSMEDLRRIFPDQTKLTSAHLDQFVRRAYRGYPPPPLAVHNFCSRMAQTRYSHTKSGLPLATFLDILCDLEADYDRDTNADNKISQLNLYASRLGERVADTIIRHVMFLLLAILLILTELATWKPDVSPIAFGLETLHRHASVVDAAYLELELQSYANATKPIFLFLADANATAVHSLMAKWMPLYLNPADIAINNDTIALSPGLLQRFRATDLDVRTFPPQCTRHDIAISCHSIAVFDRSSAVREMALAELFQTIFILCCFAVGGAFLTADIYKRVIVPLEKMVSLTQQLAMNPCKNIQVINSNEPMDELTLLQKTLAKVARLLQIGYGSAGAAIISKTMMGEEFNPIVPGKRIHGVFGFCDIRRFTDITECLQDRVMTFTNSIGGIVHNAAYMFNGHANKNVGDAFLLVWTIPDDSPDVAVIKQAKPPSHLAVTQTSDVEFLFFDEEGSKKMAQSTVWVATVADNALMAFLKTMVDIDQSMALKKYCHEALLLERFEAPFRVKMGYGLHVGWAIDGAIGSKYKIDASYLSSDVNMASSLENASKIYRVPLVMSHSFYNLLSPQLQQFCRCIDCVWFDGMEKPTGLFTCDYVNPNIKLFRGLGDVAELQVGLLPNFNAMFDGGVSAYLRGDWRTAKNTFELILTLKPKDGPAETLMEFMQRHEFAAPVDWPGYRPL
ncbi:hypothetical protein LEN26_010939 [Aphanomyces euteiches]|nr:hypothetical protein LEN26_010939 [Aphanomyces euteiches]